MTIKKFELAAEAATKRANEWLAENNYTSPSDACNFVEGWLLRTLAGAVFGEEKAEEAMRIIRKATGPSAWANFAKEIEKVRD